MKALVTTLILALFTFALPYAQTSIKKSGKTYSDYTINNGKQSAKIEVNGEILFNDDDTAIQNMSPNGSITYKKDDEKLVIVSDKQGNLSYKINGKEKTSFTAEEQHLITECIQFLIDHGVAAKERAAKLYAQGGFDAVFSEIPRLKSDYTKVIYMTLVSSKETISTDHLIRLLRQTNDELSSDYYKTNVLKNINATQLENHDVSIAYIGAITHMQSDYYRTEVAKRILVSPLSHVESSKVLDFIKLMDSDYYKAQLLSSVLTNADITDEKFKELIHTSSSINSDYYRVQVLSALLKRKKNSQNSYSLTIAAMDGIQSDYYKGQILNQLIDKNITDKDEWINLLKYTQKINSDYEKSKILIRIGQAMPNESTLKENFKEVAKTISSDSEYGKVMRAIERKI